MADIGGLGTVPVVASLSSVPLIEGGDKNSSVTIVPGLGSTQPSMHDPSGSQPPLLPDSLPPETSRLGVSLSPATVPFLRKLVSGE